MTAPRKPANVISAEPVTVHLVLDVPWSINHAYIVAPRTSSPNGRRVPPRVVKDPRVKQYQHGIVIAAASTPPGRFVLLPPISLKVRMVVMREADIDIDNGLKVLVDGLAHAYSFNDRGVLHLEIDKAINPLAMPRCEVELSGMRAS